jgi:outer membrane protein assembly factor BamB
MTVASYRGVGGRGAAIFACAAMLVFAIALPAAGQVGGPENRTAGADWPAFRFNAAHSGDTPETIINSTNVSTLTAGWTAKASRGSDGSPAVVRNSKTKVVSVFVADNGGVVYSYNAATGALLWSHQAVHAKILSSPAVFDGVVYVAGEGEGVVFALNASTGARVCSFITGKKIEASPTVVADPDGSGPVVYIGTLAHGGEWAIYGAGNTHGQCTEEWFFNGFTQSTADGTWSSAAYGTDASGENLVVFGSTNPDDSVYALDAATGSLVWTYKTSNGSEQDVGASPLISAPGVDGIADGALYVEGKDRVVYALDLATGALLWSFNIATVNPTSGACVSSAALVDNTLLVGSNVGLFALNASTGAEDWNALSTATIASSPSISGGRGERVAFVGGLFGDLYAVDVATGAVLWTEKTKPGFYASPATSRGVMFDIDTDGLLQTYALS